MSSKSRNRTSRAGSTPSRTVRERKRAQFEAPRRSKLLPIIACIAVVAAVASVGVYFVVGRAAPPPRPLPPPLPAAT